MCCGPRGGQGCAWSRKLDPNFCSGRVITSEDLGIRLPRSPPFSRLLRHAGGYSRTILTTNLPHFIPMIRGYVEDGKVYVCNGRYIDAVRFDLHNISRQLV